MRHMRRNSWSGYLERAHWQLGKEKVAFFSQSMSNWWRMNEQNEKGNSMFDNIRIIDWFQMNAILCHCMAVTLFICILVEQPQADNQSNGNQMKIIIEWWLNTKELRLSIIIIYLSMKRGVYFISIWFDWILFWCAHKISCHSIQFRSYL